MWQNSQPKINGRLVRVNVVSFFSDTQSVPMSTAVVYRLLARCMSIHVDWTVACNTVSATVRTMYRSHLCEAIDAEQTCGERPTSSILGNYLGLQSVEWCGQHSCI